jgi:hypothetical protein
MATQATGGDVEATSPRRHRRVLVVRGSHVAESRSQWRSQHPAIRRRSTRLVRQTFAFRLQLRPSGRTSGRPAPSTHRCAASSIVRTHRPWSIGHAMAVLARVARETTMTASRRPSAAVTLVGTGSRPPQQIIRGTPMPHATPPPSTLKNGVAQIIVFAQVKGAKSCRFGGCQPHRPCRDSTPKSLANPANLAAKEGH